MHKGNTKPLTRRMLMSMFGKDWENGVSIAKFKCTTNGPEGMWDTEMRIVKLEAGKRYFVVYDPFANRLMWFDGDRLGNIEARVAFRNIVELAMCDADEGRNLSGKS